MWMLKRIQGGETFTRADIGTRFNCTIQTASATVAQFQKRHPGIMRYCGRTKAFVPSDHVPDADVSWKARALAAEADRDRLQGDLDRNIKTLKFTSELWDATINQRDRLQSELNAAREGLRAAKQLCDEAIPEFNWGASCLSANAIRVLNEAPGIIARALLSNKGEDERPEPTQDASADDGGSCPKPSLACERCGAGVGELCRRHRSHPMWTAPSSQPSCPEVE